MYHDKLMVFGLSHELPEFPNRLRKQRDLKYSIYSCAIGKLRHQPLYQSYSNVRYNDAMTLREL